MRIGINCIVLDPDYRGGINTYALGLLDGFCSAGCRHTFQIYVTEKNKGLFEVYSRFGNMKLVVVPYQGKVSFLKKVFRELTVFTGSIALHRSVTDLLFSDIVAIMNRNSDVLYTPTTTLFPYTLEIPQILSMHDIQQFHYPQFFSKRDLISRKVKFRISAENADYLQASSTFIKEDLLEHFDCLKPEQIVVIPEGVAIEEFRQQTDFSVLKQRYSLPDDYIFLPAQLWHHKNHITVLKALLKIREECNREMPLVLTGGKFSAAEEIFDFIRVNRMAQVYYLGKVPFGDIVTLYQHARCFVTAVLYESSSLPVLEATAAGCQCIASDTPPNREMSQRLDMNLFDPLDEKSLADLLVRVWDDEHLRREQVAVNNERIAYYSWNNIAARYIEFLEQRFLVS